MSEQPNRSVNCSCCGQSGERGDFYRDKINDRYACVDPEACIRRQRLRGRTVDQQRDVTAEAFLVRELGEQIGYGNMMHLARDEWRTSLLKADHAGGEFAVGCCVALTVPCGCDYPCDWCNGSKWITPKVKELRDYEKRLENAFLMVYDLAGIDATPLPEALPESAYVPGYMDKVRELREVFALAKSRVSEFEEFEAENPPTATGAMIRERNG